MFIQITDITAVKHITCNWIVYIPSFHKSLIVHFNKLADMVLKGKCDGVFKAVVGNRLEKRKVD